MQNQEDYDLMRVRLHVPSNHLILIKGSGVDIDNFYPTSITDGEVRVALVSRMLWDKGIAEFVEAVKLLQRKGLAFKALLVGRPDDENIASLSTNQLQKWQAEGYVDYLGHVNDMAAFWRNTHIAVLPSYREGLPKSLLEAASSGRPIVTTNTSGCKEVVEDGVNGILVPIKAVTELADAIEKLVLDVSLRKKMGLEGRKKVEEQFSDAIVISRTLAVYRELL
ncbi:MAG: glycosyltransferase family 4 protein [Methylomonas sp.]|nr:glycosyltransferase family 4 protein [Methylomonas sp.]